MASTTISKESVKLIVFIVFIVGIAANVLYNNYNGSWNFGYVSFIVCGCLANFLAVYFSIEFKDRELFKGATILTLFVVVFGFITIPIKGSAYIFVPIASVALLFEGLLYEIFFKT